MIKYQFEGSTYLSIDDVLTCVRIEARKAREENKKTFTVETDCFD